MQMLRYCCSLKLQVCFWWAAMFKNNWTVRWSFTFINLFHFFYFILIAPFSFSLCFPVSQSFLLFLKPLLSVAENLLHTYAYSIVYVVCLVAQLCPTLCNPMDCSSPGSSVHGDSPGKYTEVSCHAFLQGIFPIQRSNSGLPNCRQILYRLSHQGSPGMCNI